MRQLSKEEEILVDFIAATPPIGTMKESPLSSLGSSIKKCIFEDGKRVVDTVLDISDTGRAVKNDPALFVLAMCAGLGDDFTRKYALTNLPKIARIGTHLFHFAGYVEQFRGWGRGLRKAIANWYLLKETDKLAYQSVKYLHPTLRFCQLYL